MARLSEIFDLQMGKTPARANLDYWNGGTNNWISIADLSGYEKYVGETKERISDLAVQESGIKAVPPNTVIMSFKLSLGKTAITREPVYTNEAIMAFIPNGSRNILPDYFFYMLSGKDWSIKTNRAVMGATLNKAVLGAIDIVVPPIEEQRYVSSVLDKLSGLISLRKRQLAKLDELVKARFVEMFGDPVHNPMNWDTVPLSSIGTFKNGMNFHADDSGAEIHCLGVGDFKHLSFIYDTSHLPIVSLQGFPSDDYMLQDGDIVFVRSNGNKALVGRSLAVYPGNISTTFSGFCIRFRPDSEIIETKYILMTLKTASMREKMVGRGANIQNLNQKILSELVIPVPPLSLQNKFALFVEQTNESALTIQQSLDKLDVLKKSLMQEYFG